MKKFTKLLAAVALTAFAGIASAGPITGIINFSGDYTTDTDNNFTATVFNFLNPTDVGAADGSFAPLSGTTVTYGVLDINALPSSPLWSSLTGPGYNFNLTNITSDSIVGGSFRLIKGFGDITVGSDTQVMSWLFSTQGGGTGTPKVFTFSASSVPEPAMVLLLATGLIGFGFARKVRKA